MSKTVSALYQLVGQLVEKKDDTDIAPVSRMFRHAAVTPLSNLLLCLDLAATHVSPPNPYLADALHSAQRLRKLFELAGTDTLVNRERFRVKPAILETSLFLGQHRYHLQDHLNLAGSTTLVGNKFLFQEALLCALKNAVESYRLNTALKIVTLSATETSSHVTISIGDGGCGLNIWQKALVFADGYSTKSSGTGVGLSWIKRVVINHFHGKLELLSKVGHGTTLVWHLPKITQV